MNCALCLDKEATKKNTHYLTDGIIRSCLNLEGSNERGKGFYFDMSSKTAGVGFNFQRETPTEKLEKTFGRLPSDEEIDKAKKIPFSVDNVFCPDCEKIFTGIENQFLQDILPQFRDSNLTGVDNKSLEQVKELRLFFYIQIWRTAVCDSMLKLTASTSETLRLFIFEKEKFAQNELTIFPLTVTYLETLGTEHKYTSNFVGLTNDTNPNIILFNDFIIQFYESDTSIKFDSFYGLNNELTFKDNINFNEQRFLIPIINNEKREEIFNKFLNEEKVKQTLVLLEYIFTRQWQRLYNFSPPIYLKQHFISGIVTNKNNSYLNYTEEQIVKYTNDFFKSLRFK